MKKLSIAVSTMACAALVLSGCGNSVSDDRAEAYASLSSMTSLSSSQAQEYKQRLTVAPDSAAIKSVLAEAKAANEKSQANNAAAAAEQAADDKIIKQTEAAITGVKLVGLSDECEGVTLTLKADKTWDITKQGDGCIKPQGKYWGIASGPELVFTDDKDDLYGSLAEKYPLTINGDGTVTIQGSNPNKFTITK